MYTAKKTHLVIQLTLLQCVHTNYTSAQWKAVKLPQSHKKISINNNTRERETTHFVFIMLKNAIHKQQPEALWEKLIKNEREREPDRFLRENIESVAKYSSLRRIHQHQLSHTNLPSVCILSLTELVVICVLIDWYFKNKNISRVS